MTEIVSMHGPRLYVTYTDWHWATMQMARFRGGADYAMFARPTNRGFHALDFGERFVFKGARDQLPDGPIFGDARFIDCIEMPARTAWRLFGNAVGHPDLDAWLTNLAGYSSQKGAIRSVDNTITMIVLEDLRFLAPVDWLPEPMDWVHGMGFKRYYEMFDEGAQIAQTLDHILGSRSQAHRNAAKFG